MVPWSATHTAVASAKTSVLDETPASTQSRIPSTSKRESFSAHRRQTRRTGNSGGGLELGPEAGAARRESGMARVLEAERDVGLTTGDEPLDRIGLGRHGLFDAVFSGRRTPHDDRRQDRFAIGEVGVDRRRRDPHLAGHRPEGHGL